jgi:hypothetical protein
MVRGLKDEIDEGGRIYQALTQDQIRMMRNWIKGKDGTPIGGSGSFNLVGTNSVYESRIPILYGEAVDVEAAVKTLPGRYQCAVRQFWTYEGRSLRWHARHRHMLNENSEDFVNPNLHYETFERWVLQGHELLMPEIDRRHAAQKALRDRSEAAIAQAARADPGRDAAAFALAVATHRSDETMSHQRECGGSCQPVLSGGRMAIGYSPVDRQKIALKPSFVG